MSTTIIIKATNRFGVRYRVAPGDVRRFRFGYCTSGVPTVAAQIRNGEAISWAGDMVGGNDYVVVYDGPTDNAPPYGESP